jgi:hypothetical protein
MKYEVGDKITVLLTNEDGKVVEIMNEKMVMIEVKGVRFPAYMDQIDFPYFKMFTQKKSAGKEEGIHRPGAQRKSSGESKRRRWSEFVIPSCFQ